MADDYDGLLKPQLQRLAKRRGLDDGGTVAELRARLREQDEAEQEDDEEEEYDEEEDDEDTPPTLNPSVSEDADELRSDYFRFTVEAGNPLFFEDPLWNAANEELAMMRAGEAGVRHVPALGKMERVVEGNRVHYQFPVEKVL